MRDSTRRAATHAHAIDDAPQHAIDASAVAEIRGRAGSAGAASAATGGRDPRTLGEAWRWCRSYRFPEDVCEYAGAAGAALDPSAAAVAVYGCAQMVFAYRAFRRARASDEPGREAALGRGFLLDIPVARVALSCSRV